MTITYNFWVFYCEFECELFLYQSYQNIAKEQLIIVSKIINILFLEFKTNYLTFYSTVQSLFYKIIIYQFHELILAGHFLLVIQVLVLHLTAHLYTHSRWLMRYELIKDNQITWSATKGTRYKFTLAYQAEMADSFLPLIKKRRLYVTWFPFHLTHWYTMTDARYLKTNRCKTDIGVGVLPSFWHLVDSLLHPPPESICQYCSVGWSTRTACFTIQ